jgi:hypothetical protein
MTFSVETCAGCEDVRKIILIHSSADGPDGMGDSGPLEQAAISSRHRKPSRACRQSHPFKPTAGEEMADVLEQSSRSDCRDGFLRRADFDLWGTLLLLRHHLLPAPDELLARIPMSPQHFDTQ